MRSLLTCLLTSLALVATSPILRATEIEISKPLLRVWPAFRPEECEDWAILPFVCKRCLNQGKQYAQKIYFYEKGPYRLHGCYLEPEGFQSVEETL